MEYHVIERLPFRINAEELAARLKVEGSLYGEFEAICREAVDVANPKLLYARAEIDSLEGGRAVVGGMRFTSKVLCVNLRDVKATYPYVATGGRELHDLSMSKDDPLERYWIDSIAERILMEGLAGGRAAVAGREGTGELCAMNPGSLPDWPISEQRPLFELLGDVMGRIGVELTDSCLMIPIKSCSGLFFESSEHYSNCSLCPRDMCPGRREPFNEALALTKYGLGDDS